MAEDFDLFGERVCRADKKAGRPAHEVTSKKRNRVMMLLALGWSDERIAAALAISKPTLRKHYFSELKARDIARDRLDAARIDLVWTLAKSGNVGALKELSRMIEKSDLMLAQSSFSNQDEDRAPRLGKKEAAALAAEGAGEGSEWGDDLRIPSAMN